MHLLSWNLWVVHPSILHRVTCNSRPRYTQILFLEQQNGLSFDIYHRKLLLKYGQEADCQLHLLLNHSSSTNICKNTLSWLAYLQLITWNYVYKKIKNVTPGDRTSNVISLKCPTLILLSMDPRSKCQLQNKHLTCFWEENWSFCSNHLHTIKSRNKEHPSWLATEGLLWRQEMNSLKHFHKNEIQFLTWWSSSPPEVLRANPPIELADGAQWRKSSFSFILTTIASAWCAMLRVWGLREWSVNVDEETDL